MISIIVPVYNTSTYLSSCLDSIRTQTLSDWELVLVDDGSTDGSGRICDDYASSDARIKVIHLENGGPAKARNVALAQCHGEFVAFIDSDDLLHCQYLEVLLRTLTGQKADIVQSPYVLLSEKDRKQYLSKTNASLPEKFEIKRFSGHEAIESMLYQREMDSSPIKLYRREILKGEVFPEQVTVYEDLLALLDVYARCEKVCWINLPIYYYFKRMDGTLNSHSIQDSQALTVMKQARTWISHYDKALLPAVDSRELSLAFNILRLLRKAGKEEGVSLRDACWQIIRRNRKQTFRDPKMRLKNKVGILISYLLLK